METLKTVSKKVEIIVKDGARTPYEKMDEWQRKAYGYRVTLAYQGRKFSLDFWQGVAIKTEPTAESVLECLLSDAMSIGEDASFSDFCANLGYNEDSRHAFKIFKNTLRQTERLRKLLGADCEAFLEAERD